MFQTCPLSHNPEYMIRKPSLTAPHNPNACPRFFLQMASPGQTSNDPSKQSRKYTLKNPLLQRNPHDEQDRRRRVYLEKVRQISDDKKWESRSEQMMREDFLSRQKEWEVDQARSAPDAPPALDDDDDDDDDEEREEESGSMEEVEMVDQILSREDQEFEALVSSMQDDADQEHHRHTTISDYGSDEDEYDQLFMEVMSEKGSADRNNSTVGDDAHEQHQEMDISVG